MLNVSLFEKATVVHSLPNMGYCFADAGTGKQILCHLNQGGKMILPQLSMKPNFIRNKYGQLPSKGTEIMLLRSSTDIKNPGYTRALAWCYGSDMMYINEQLRLRTQHRVVSFGHLTNGKRQSNTDTELVVIEAELSKIIAQYPRGVSGDRLAETYKTKLGNLTITCQNYWQVLDESGDWVECGDPRPVAQMPPEDMVTEQSVTSTGTGTTQARPTKRREQPVRKQSQLPAQNRKRAVKKLEHELVLN